MEKIIIIKEKTGIAEVIEEKDLVKINMKNKEYLKAINYLRKSKENEYIQITKKMLENMYKAIEKKELNLKAIQVIIKTLIETKRNYKTKEIEISENIKEILKNDRRQNKKIKEFMKENELLYWKGKTHLWVKEKKKLSKENQ